MQIDGTKDYLIALPEPLRQLVQEINFARPYVIEISAYVSPNTLSACDETLTPTVFDQLQVFERAGFKLEDYIASDISAARASTAQAFIEAYEILAANVVETSSKYFRTVLSCKATQIAKAQIHVHSEYELAKRTKDFYARWKVAAHKLKKFDSLSFLEWEGAVKASFDLMIEMRDFIDELNHQKNEISKVRNSDLQVTLSVIGIVAGIITAVAIGLMFEVPLVGDCSAVSYWLNPKTCHAVASTTDTQASNGK